MRFQDETVWLTLDQMSTLQSYCSRQNESGRTLQATVEIVYNFVGAIDKPIWDDKLDEKN